MTHLGFVTASYLFAFAIFAALVIWLMADRRATRNELARLEEAGVRRRSDVKADG